MNRIRGKIIEIESDGDLSLVTIEAEQTLFSSTVIDTPDTASYLKEGREVYMVFKETEMSISKGLSGGLSLRNRFPGAVTAIDRGKILTKVELDFRGRLLRSIITTRSAHSLELKVGDRVEGMVKTTEVSLMETTD